MVSHIEWILLLWSLVQCSAAPLTTLDLHTSLGKSLAHIYQLHTPQCFLTLIFDDTRFQLVVQDLLQALPGVPMQLWSVGKAPNWESVIWESPSCETHFLLLGSRTESFLDHLNQDSPRWNYASRFSERYLGTVEAFMMVVKAHVRESSVKKTSQDNLRVFLAMLWFYGLIVTTAFSSNLTAFLTVKESPRTFETVRQLRQEEVEISAVGGFFGNALISSADEDLRALSKHFVAYDKLEDVWPKVLNGSSVYLHTKTILQYHQADFVGRVRILKECFSQFYIVFYLGKNSLLRGKFDPLLMRMVEAGLPRKWFHDGLVIATKKKHTNVNQENFEADHKFVNLSTAHLQGIFLVLCIGCLLGFVAFVVEIIRSTFHGRHRIDRK